jgi:hypothetical protein
MRNIIITIACVLLFAFSCEKVELTIQDKQNTKSDSVKIEDVRPGPELPPENPTPRN